MNNQNFNINEYLKQDLINCFPDYETFIAELNEYIAMSYIFGSAIDELTTKLNIIDRQFKLQHQRNPIYSIRSRIKSPQSIVEKLKRKNLPISFKTARENLTDIAGVRVICHYISIVAYIP